MGVTDPRDPSTPPGGHSLSLDEELWLIHKAHPHILCPPSPRNKFIHSFNSERALTWQVLEITDRSLPRPGLRWDDFQPSGFSCPQGRPKIKGARDGADGQERKWCLG